MSKNYENERKLTITKNKENVKENFPSDHNRRCYQNDK